MGVDVPDHAVGRETRDDRPEPRVNGGLPSGDHHALKTATVQELGAAQELGGVMEEQRRVPGVAAHWAVVVALFAKAKQRRTLWRDRHFFGQLFLEQPRARLGN